MDYTPPPGITLGPNEYRAGSGPMTVTCTATATNPTGALSYQWSSTCSDCAFRNATSRSVTQQVVHSTATGTHTCTVIDLSGRNVPGNASIVIKVVGKLVV